MAGFARAMGQHPGETFVFIVGMDTLSRIDTWDDYESVVKDTALMAAWRADTAPTALDELRRRLGVLGQHLRVTALEVEHAQMSSTQIRQQLRAGEQPEGLEAGVLEYIVAQGLYRA
jgi:nicotinic acid mononucleotide adenylyltransferase